ncbi:MAG: 2-hydroxyacyl-CoA dehydratase [Dehalococcoidales bacterium]|nr:2-hydroxyacyl-CoA dehydratase [Dehalococcoidales bacterium]
MNLIDAEIERTEKRLKKIDANPDPKRMKSNRMYYELVLSQFVAMRDAWRQGKPCGGIGGSLGRAMGFQGVGYPLLVSRFPEEIPRYTEILRNIRWPEHICEFITLGFAAAIAGDAPPPSLIVMEKGECTVGTYATKALTEHFNVPSFIIDDPLEYNEESIKYVADQLGELIEFAESKIPGVKYDRDKHLELLEAQRIGYTYVHKDWQLRKRVPLPMSAVDSFHQPLEYMPAGFPDTTKALEYMRLRTEEIEEQADKGIGRDEKLRALWIWVAPFYANFFPVLMSRNVSLPAVVSGATGWHSGRRGTVGDEKEFGRKLSPLEEEARMLIGWSWRGQGPMWEDEILWSCQDLKCDAIIYFQFTGCKLTSHMARLVADRAERELGVPTLIIPGRSMYPTSLPASEFESRLAEFLDMVIAQKGRK